MGVSIVLLTNAELMFTASDLQEEAGLSSPDESSDWYYLKLVTDALEGDNNTDLYLEDDFTTGNCKGDGELYQQFLDNLCTKLSVPAAFFSVFSLDTLSPGIISVNMSVSAPGSQRNSVHSGLSEMPVFSPEFLVCGHLYTLTLLLHQAEYAGEQSRQTFTQTPDVIFFTKTLLFLSFLTVSITIIIVALMLSVARSSCNNSLHEDMELLTDDEDFSPRATSKFNLTLPRKVSSFCLNFRQILEQENYFALNT